MFSSYIALVRMHVSFDPSVLLVCTVNREYFAVKIFSDSLAYAKIKCAKTYAHYYGTAVQGCLSKNYLTRNFIARNILDTKY